MTVTRKNPKDPKKTLNEILDFGPDTPAPHELNQRIKELVKRLQEINRRIDQLAARL